MTCPRKLKRGERRFSCQEDETKRRFTAEQIIGILKEVEAGRGMKDVIREQGISQDTFYRWRRKYGGLEVNEAKRLRELEDENSRLKRWVADLTLDNRALKDVVSRKW